MKARRARPALVVSGHVTLAHSAPGCMRPVRRDPIVRWIVWLWIFWGKMIINGMPSDLLWPLPVRSPFGGEHRGPQASAYRGEAAGDVCQKEEEMQKERILPEREAVRAIAAKGAQAAAAEDVPAAPAAPYPLHRPSRRLPAPARCPHLPAAGKAQAVAGEQERRPLPLTVEESFAKLEQLLDKLEDEDSSLEEAFSYYKRGIELVQSCSAQIDKVEKQMIILQDTWQEARTASFAGPDEDESEDEEDEGL